MMEALNGFLTNIYLWMGLTFTFLALLIGGVILLWFISKKTHALKELKATLKGVPISMFFLDSGYVEWRPIKPESGLITDKDYGTYIINETGTYIDKTTKNIIIPFDAALATSVNIKAAKVADDLKHIVTDNKQLELLRRAIITNNLQDDENKLEGLKTSVQISSIKAMMTALIPHNITSKIEKAIAANLKKFGQADGMQMLMIFGGVLGAIIVGYILLKTVAN